MRELYIQRKFQFMNRYKITIQYDGSDFFGFQSQKDSNTIQNKIEKSLSFLNNNKPINIIGASRTDSGVHALGQIAHFDLKTSLDNNDIKNAMNARLPHEIRITEVESVSDKFHSRYDAKRKEYIYQCTLDNNPLLKSNYWFVKSIDLDILNHTSEKLCGNHNFLSFSKFNPEKENTMCEIFVSKWILEDEKLLYITEGNRFLHHIVRYLVGTMIACSQKKIDNDDFTNLLEDPIKDAKIFKAPANGLILNKIYYEN